MSQKNPFHYIKRNEKFESTNSLVKRIYPSGHNVLVEEMEFTKVPESKIVIPGNAQSEFFNFFNQSMSCSCT